MATARATIRYTLDGSTPTETKGAVGTSVAIGSSKTLKAIAYKSGMTDSNVHLRQLHDWPGGRLPAFRAQRGEYAMVAQSATYCTGGASTYGNPVQYQFSWGDGTPPVWLAILCAEGDRLWPSADLESS